MSRDAILGKIRRSLGRGALAAEQRQSLDARLQDPKTNLVPQRGQGERAAQLDCFEDLLRAQAGSLVRLKEMAQVPAAVNAYLKEKNLPAKVRLAPDALFDDLPWEKEPLLERSSGPSEGEDLVSLTGVLAGVAETGTLMIASGANNPTTLNFLPDHHLVVLKADQVVGAYEDVWPLIRDQYGKGNMPRTVNCITGPSRTGDIEQKIELGAHGPRSLHVLLIDEEAN